MGYCPKKTIEDLEFAEVLKQVATFAVTPLGQNRCLQLSPHFDLDLCLNELQKVAEFTSSFDNENRIPNHGHEDATAAFSLLKIENSVLEVKSFRDLAANATTVNVLLKFFKKFKEYYAQLFILGQNLPIEKEIKTEVDSVIDRFGEIHSNASEELYAIRKQLQGLRGKISSSFNKALTHCNNLAYLDDIRESVLENKRVLAVKAMYRRKVKGAIMGSSKTGSIVFMEPEATHALTRELQNLLYEEKEEIKKILSQLTDYFRPLLPLLQAQQEYLLALDVCYARAKYAEAIGGILPEFSQDEQMHFREAYHPLLLWTNRFENKPTYPQDISLASNQRIVVISGPNAGGKSITLKTVGLLQLMLQSGLLIPVHERSTALFFQKILTDIGDNQSIENHLSTYSYRLKNMKTFLKRCDAETLFLIDEFGTGSDPELGGALAETMLEDFYERKAFGLITTHYANLKALANEMPAMVNANMQFNNKTLEPIFKLIMGEAGSSFTFEVAQKNGLPFNLINRAKKKMERGKVRFDATIAKLQKERSQMVSTEKALKEKETQADKEAQKMNVLNEKLQKKLSDYQELFDHNQRMIVLGNKFNDVAERFFNTNKKRPLVAELLRLTESENAKRKKKTAALAKKDREQKKKTAQLVEKEILKVRVEKKKKKKQPQPELKPKTPIKLGDQVRLIDGQSVGIVEVIERNQVVVNYGLFTTKAKLDQLEFVKRTSKK